MKKLLFSSAIVACTALLLVSCKKDRVCKCTYAGNTEEVTFLDASKRQAKDACLSRSYDMGNGQSLEINCELE